MEKARSYETFVCQLSFTVSHPKDHNISIHRRENIRHQNGHVAFDTVQFDMRVIYYVFMLSNVFIHLWFILRCSQ